MNKTELCLAAEQFAVKAHGDQKYGDAPYLAHLVHVITVLRDHGAVSNPTMVAAAWLHDTVEDTATPIETIRETFGDKVAILVWAVTSEPGRNRKERNSATYPKLREYPAARVLKLADRIANVQHAWDKQNPILFMYFKEYRDFREALRPKYRPDMVAEEGWASVEKEMWDRLDKLLGWWEPPTKG